MLRVFTCKCASRNSGVQFFDIRTSKSGPIPTCFVHFHLQMRSCYSGVQFFDTRTSKSGPTPWLFWHFDLWMCFSPQRRAIFPHQNFKKWTDTVSFLAFWLVNAIFPHQNFKKRSNTVSLLTFWLVNVPQRRAIFPQQNFKKCSEHDVFCTFWLQNVLFAAAACNFWFLCWIPTSAPAALTGLLFDWPDTRIIEKTQHFATSVTFGADVSSFFWLSR